MRYFVVTLIALMGMGCGSAPAPTAASTAPAPKAEPVKITQFYAPDKKIPKGLKGSLCYGVEHASKVELSPAVDDVWPSPTRCFEIAPKESTKYTLTAYGEDGSKTSQSVDVTVGSAPPRLYDLSVNSTLVNKGDQVVVCFKVENATSVKASPGHLDAQANCVTDKPEKTTSYKIQALGSDRQIDSGTVTVKVR
jgi:hypothetical protein